MVKLYVKLNKNNEDESLFTHLISVDSRSDFGIVVNFLNTVNVHPDCDVIKYHANVHGSYVSQEELKLLEENAELLDVNLVYEGFDDESEV